MINWTCCNKQNYCRSKKTNFMGDPKQLTWFFNFFSWNCNFSKYSFVDFPIRNRIASRALLKRFFGWSKLMRKRSEMYEKNVWMRKKRSVWNIIFGNSHTTQWPKQRYLNISEGAKPMGSNLFPGFPTQNARAHQRVPKSNFFENFHNFRCLENEHFPITRAILPCWVNYFELIITSSETTLI
jgi:hypothetical protein